MGEMTLQTFAGKPVEVPNAVKGELWILDNTGHSKKTWDSHNADEVADARRSFNELRQKGFLAYKVNKDGKASAEQMLEFDPNAEAVILSPAPVGG